MTRSCIFDLSAINRSRRKIYLLMFGVVTRFECVDMCDLIQFSIVQVVVLRSYARREN